MSTLIYCQKAARFVTLSLVLDFIFLQIFSSLYSSSEGEKMVLDKSFTTHLDRKLCTYFILGVNIACDSCLTIHPRSDHRNEAIIWIARYPFSPYWFRSYSLHHSMKNYYCKWDIREIVIYQQWQVSRCFFLAATRRVCGRLLSSSKTYFRFCSPRCCCSLAKAILASCERNTVQHVQLQDVWPIRCCTRHLPTYSASQWPR